MEECFYTCPYCFTKVSILVDNSVPSQQYIEDCENCCNPVEFSISIDKKGKVDGFEAKPVG